MSIEVNRKLRLVPVEQKQPQHSLTPRRIMRRPQRPIVLRKSTGRATANPKAVPTDVQGRDLPPSPANPDESGRKVTE